MLAAHCPQSLTTVDLAIGEHRTVPLMKLVGLSSINFRL